MPLELVATGIRQCEVREYEDRTPGPGEVLVRTLIATEKHGTHLQFYRGETPFSGKTFDGAHGLFMPMEPAPPSEGGGGGGGATPLGNEAVGIVEQVGAEVEGLQVGDRVCGALPIRASYTVPAGRLTRVPDALTNEMAVCLDPAIVAFTGVREAKVTLGETVAVFGLGAIGLMTVQLAKLAGATLVIAVEPIPLRAELGRAYGADLVLDLAENRDAGLQIRQATGMDGVDISIETSGNHVALHHAIRGTRYAGTIVPVAWYHGEARGLELGEEWHFNRHTMVSGARVESLPYRDAPRWDENRLRDTIVQLYAQGKLTVEGMLNPRVPITQAAEAYQLIDQQPAETIKLAVDFTGAAG